MSPASKGSRKPAVPVSKVPSVRELCELLGFQRASLKDTNIFMDTAHNWRKSYTTSNGQPATQLLLWNQSSVQIELQAMAEKFLEDEGNGERFWSSSRTWSQDSDLQFPEDRARYEASGLRDRGKTDLVQNCGTDETTILETESIRFQ